MNDKKADFAGPWQRSSHGTGDDSPWVEVARLVNGGMAMRASNSPDEDILYFTAAEWDAFVKGAENGEFD